MQVRVEIEEDIGETQVTIKCRERNVSVDKLIAALLMTDRQMAVFRDGNRMSLDLEKILYMESVDGKCFVYTEDAVYESRERLYTLEGQLEPYRFVRIQKSVIVNLKHIQAIKTYVNRRLLLTMQNGEQLIASRQYAERIKELLGVK